jgi:large subunit ribosomal protein L11
MLMRAAGIEPRKNRLRGSMNPGKDEIGKISLKHLYEIAKIKRTEPRLSVLSEEAMVKCLIGSCKSMGLTVVA